MDNITIYDILYSLSKSQDVKLCDDIKVMLESSNVLNIDETKVLNSFKYLCEEVNGIPQAETLVSQDVMYQTANEILPSTLMNFTNKLIHSHKCQILAATLSDNATKLINGEPNLAEITDSINTSLAKYGVKAINEEELSNLDNEFYEKLLEQEKVTKGIPFGIDALDNIHPGITPYSVTVIAGFTGSMKTTLAANIAYNAIRDGKNVLYISLEVNKSDLTINLLSRHSISSSKDSYTREDIRELGVSDKDKYMELVNSYQELPGKLRIIDESDIKGYTQASFLSLFNQVNKELIDRTGKGFEVLVVDHMQLLKFDETYKKADPYQVVNAFASFFRQYTAKNGIGTILVSQTSRDGYKQAKAHGGRYELTSLAEANELERAATCVVTLFSSDSLKTSGEIQAQIIKSRNTETMPEPTIVSIRPEYYLVGTGSDRAEDIAPSFNTELLSSFGVQQNETIDLEALLGM